MFSDEEKQSVFRRLYPKKKPTPWTYLDLLQSYNNLTVWTVVLFAIFLPVILWLYFDRRGSHLETMKRKLKKELEKELDDIETKLERSFLRPISVVHLQKALTKIEKCLRASRNNQIVEVVYFGFEQKTQNSNINEIICCFYQVLPNST